MRVLMIKFIYAELMCVIKLELKDPLMAGWGGRDEKVVKGEKTKGT